MNPLLNPTLPEPAYKEEFTAGTLFTYRNPTQMTLWEKLYIPEVLRGLSITGAIFFRNMGRWFIWLWYWMRGRADEAVRGAVTIYYPEETRPDMTRINRGKHILTQRANGEPQCVACYMCATACPAWCIHIDAGEHPDPSIEKYPVRFDIEIDKCIFCGYCEEACPVDAIRLTTDYHTVDYRREKMIYDRDYLLTWNPTQVEDEHIYPGGAPRQG